MTIDWLVDFQASFQPAESVGIIFSLCNTIICSNMNLQFSFHQLKVVIAS